MVRSLLKIRRIELLLLIKMQSNNNSPSEQQIFSAQQQDLQCMQLRQKISIKQLQLHSLISDRQKFMNTVLELLNQALIKINVNEKQELKFALVFLKQSEKVLEYAASSGKNINKELIINILHNQASIYQKLWQLNNCSNYLEGIIYNYDLFIRETSTQGSVIQQQDYHADNHMCEAMDPVRVRMKQKLARYHLQFCAVSSQLTDHEAALTSVKRAHFLMSQCINGSLDQMKKQFAKELECDNNALNTRISLLHNLINYDRRFEDKFDYSQISKNILKCTHFALQILEENKRNRKDCSTTQDKQYCEYLGNYSIGNIVQIIPIKFDSSEIGLVSVMKDKRTRDTDRQFHIHNKIILLSTCFFSRATELRLKSVQIYKKNLEERKFSREYKLSVNYHLLAVMLVALFVPYNVKYLSQILLSYEKHYGTSLIQYKTVQPESMSKIAQLLHIEVVDYCTVHETPKKQQEHIEIDSKNQYNLKINFNSDKLKKLDKMKSLKKITKELTEPSKRYEDKELKTINKSKENKTSFSITKCEKKERTQSKNQTLKKSPNFKDKEKQKQDKNSMPLFHKQTPKAKPKKMINEMAKSRNREQKKSRTKQVIDETEQLFFCFTKKTKKTQGVATINSPLRSSSIGSTSAKSKNSKKSVLSPRNIKVKGNLGIKSPKSPPKRKNIGDAYYF